MFVSLSVDLFTFFYRVYYISKLVSKTKGVSSLLHYSFRHFVYAIKLWIKLLKASFPVHRLPLQPLAQILCMHKEVRGERGHGFVLSHKTYLWNTFISSRILKILSRENLFLHPLCNRTSNLPHNVPHKFFLWLLLVLLLANKVVYLLSVYSYARQDCLSVWF